MTKYAITRLMLCLSPLMAGPSTMLPLVFERNAGQTDAQVKYLTHGQRGTVWLTEQGPVLGVAEKSSVAVLRLRFEGGRRAPEIEGVKQTGGVSNYFLGNDPAKWRTGVAQFEQVRYREVYPGIDVVFYGNGSNLEYDFVVRPGADPSRIRLKFDGPGALTKDSNGDLVMKMGDTEVRNHKPVISQDARTVEGEFVLSGKHTARFSVGAYDRSRALVIDPVMTYGTLLGGSLGEAAAGVAIDAQGNLYVVGTTSSPNFPVVNALISTLPTSVPGLNGTPVHAFLAKINPKLSGPASVIYSTLFGGSILEQGLGVGVDSNGEAIITGQTASPDLPLKNAFNPTFCGLGVCQEGFVTKFSATGSALVYSSYLGGIAGFVAPLALTMDASGNAWLAGYTTDPFFPVTGNALQSSAPATSGGSDAGFISEVSPTGALTYSTYFTTQGVVQINALAVDATGNVYFGGVTASTSLPTTPGAFQRSPAASAGADTGFVGELNPSVGLLYCTYLGGSTGDGVFGIGVDASGNIYVTGTANSSDFPVTPTAFRTTWVDNNAGLAGEGFLTKLNPAGSGLAQLVYSTFFGGSGDDTANALRVDSAGRVFITGTTNSPDLKTTPDALQCCYASSLPAGEFATYGFLARLDPSKSGAASLLYSTYLGGTESTQLSALALDSTGNNVVVGGFVQSAGAPVTPSAFQSTFAGQNTSIPEGQGIGDAYVASFNFATTGPAIAFFKNGAGLSALPNAKIAPGLIFTLEGAFTGPPSPSLGQFNAATGHFATNVEGVQVLVNGIACPLTYVSNTVINAIAPYELANTTGFANVQVVYNGAAGNAVFAPIAPTAPGILSLADGTGPGVIANADQSLNTAQNPAARGSIITIYATGEGQTTPPGVDGGIASDFANLPHPVAPLTVTIGGVPATDIRYAGTAPAEVYGLLQVNVTVPSGVTPGSAVQVIITVGGVSSQAGLTMAVN